MQRWTRWQRLHRMGLNRLRWVSGCQRSSLILTTCWHYVVKFTPQTKRQSIFNLVRNDAGAIVFAIFFNSTLYFLSNFFLQQVKNIFPPHIALHFHNNSPIWLFNSFSWQLILFFFGIHAQWASTTQFIETHYSTSGQQFPWWADFHPHLTQASHKTKVCLFGSKTPTAAHWASRTLVLSSDHHTQEREHFRCGSSCLFVCH